MPIDDTIESIKMKMINSMGVGNIITKKESTAIGLQIMHTARMAVSRKIARDIDNAVLNSCFDDYQKKRFIDKYRNCINKKQYDKLKKQYNELKTQYPWTKIYTTPTTFHPKIGCTPC